MARPYPFRWRNARSVSHNRWHSVWKDVSDDDDVFVVIIIIISSVTHRAGSAKRGCPSTRTRSSRDDDDDVEEEEEEEEEEESKQSLFVPSCTCELKIRYGSFPCVAVVVFRVDIVMRRKIGTLDRAAAAAFVSADAPPAAVIRDGIRAIMRLIECRVVRSFVRSVVLESVVVVVVVVVGGGGGGGGGGGRDSIVRCI